MVGFRGSSLSYYAPPYSAPPPSAAATTTSSSTLSPLAPPFTVDRAAPRPSLPYDPYASAWPPRSQPSDTSLHLRPPSPSPPPGSPPRPAFEATAAAADGLPYFGHSRSAAVAGLARVPSSEAGSRRNSNLAEAEPYYPHYSSAAATSRGDVRDFSSAGREGEGSLSASGYLGGHAALPDAPFGVRAEAEGVARSSPWMQRENLAAASGYGVPFQQDVSTRFGAYEDLQGGWHGKLAESPSGQDHFKYEHLDWLGVGKNAGISSDLSGTSALAPNASVGVCYPHSSDVHASLEGSKTFDSNSSYDRYVCQANTGRTDLMDFFPATSYFPAKIFTSTSSTSTSNDFTLKNVNVLQQENAYKKSMLHKGRVSIRPKEPTIDLNFECKGDYAETDTGKIMRKSEHGSMNASMVKISLPSNMESAMQISQDYSLGKKSELRIANLKIPGSVEYDLKQSSSERFDENLAEDSPCWKGAPSSRRSEHGTFDMLVTNSSLASKTFDNPHKRGSDYLKVESDEAALHSSGLGKDRSAVMLMHSKDPRENFGSKNNNVVQAVDEENSSMSATNVLATEIANSCTDANPTQDNSSTFRSLPNDQLSLASKTVTDVPNEGVKPPLVSDLSCVDVQLLVKTIHNLSELLLSTCRYDTNSLKEHDKELLSLAVKNLDMYIKGKAELMRPEPFCFSAGYSTRQLSTLSEGAPKGRCQATASECINESMVQSYKRGTCSGQEKMNSSGSNVGTDKLCSFLSTSGDGNFKKAMNEECNDQRENPQATACENLWFEVEDAVLLLKNKLQLLRSHTVMDNYKQRLTKDAEWEASDMLKLPSQNFKNILMGETMPPGMATDTLLLEKPLPPGKHVTASNFPSYQQMTSSSIESRVDDVDASVMARFKVLKGRIDKLNCVDLEGQHGQLNALDVVNESGIHENNCSPCPSEGKLNPGMKFRTAYGAMPAMWGYQQLCHNSGAEGQVSGSSSAQRHDVDYTDDLFVNSHFSEHRMTERFCALGTGGLPTQSSAPDIRSGKHFVTGLRDGSSDWEHVLEEELKW